MLAVMQSMRYLLYNLYTRVIPKLTSDKLVNENENRDITLHTLKFTYFNLHTISSSHNHKPHTALLTSLHQFSVVPH